MRRGLLSLARSAAATCGLVGALAASACTGKPLQLVAGTSDTVVVNDKSPVPVPMYGLDASRRRVDVRGVRFQPISANGVVLSADGHVTCAQRADATARATLGNVSTTFALLCRPIRGFAAHDRLQLIVGDAPEELNARAIGVDGQAVTLLAGSAIVEDSTIVSLENGRVRGRRPGRTFIDVGAGGCLMDIIVEVFERADSTAAMQPRQEFRLTPLRLVGGELRAWRIPRGKYELLLVPDTTARGKAILGASATNCSRWPGNEERYTCIARANASVIVRNASAPGRGHDAAANLFVTRQYDSYSDTAFARTHPGTEPAQQIHEARSRRVCPVQIVAPKRR